MYETKRDCKGKSERFGTRLVAKGFAQHEGFDFKETISSIYIKDSFRVITTLVAHLYLGVLEQYYGHALF